MKFQSRVSRAACVLLGLILVARHHSTFAQSNAPTPPPTAQRFSLTAQTGGSLSAALPLADGSMLAAEGPALLRLVPSPTQEGKLITADRLDPHFGPILDMSPSVGGVIVLATQGMFVVDPNTPLRIINTFQTGGESLAVQGSTILLAAREAGLRVFQIDSAGLITPVASLALPGETVDVVTSPDGTRVYVAGLAAGVHLVNLANPAQPQLERTLTDLAPAESVSLSGKLIAVGSAGHIKLVDPDSSQPVIGEFAPLQQGKSLIAQDDYLYVADGQDGLKILWLPTPDRPVQVYGETNHPAVDLRVSGDILFIVGTDGLRILNVGDRYRPLQVSGLALPAAPTGLALSSDGRVFVSMGDAGVAVIDVHNLSSPTLRKMIPLSGPAQAVVFESNTLYAAAGDAGLTVLSAFPGSESILTTLPLSGTATDLALYANGLFVAAGESGMIGVDVTRPNLPFVGDIVAPDVGHSITTLTLSGKRLFASQGDSFLVADAAFPGQFGRLARVPTPASHIAVIDTTIYVLSGSHIDIFDVGATAEPVRLRSYQALTATHHLTSSNDSLYVTSSGGGPDIVALSVQFPDAPYELDSLGENGSSGRVTVSNGQVILPAGVGGLRIYTVTEGGALAPITRYEPVSGSTSLAFSGSTLIAGGQTGWSTLRVPDLERLGGDDSASIRTLASDGSLLIVLREDGTLRAYSLADPAQPALLSSVPTTSPVTGLTVTQHAVFLTDAQGLSILQRETLVTTRRIATAAPAADVDIHANTAFVALTDGSLLTIDLADLTGGVTAVGSATYPRPVDLFTAPDGTILAVADNIVSRFVPGSPPALINIAVLPEVVQHAGFVNDMFVGQGGSSGLILVANSGLTDSVIAFNHMDTPAADLALGWPISYAAYGNSGWGLADLSTLQTGALISRSHAHALLRRDNVLFVLGDSLSAWDISNPTAPTQLADLALAAPGRGLDTAPDGLLLLSLESGFTIARWDGQSLTEAGTLILPGAVNRSVLLSSRAFLALSDGGVLTVNASDPSNLQPLFTIASPLGRFAHDLFPLDDARLLISWEGGVESYEIAPLESSRPPSILAQLPMHDAPATNLAVDAPGQRAAVAFADGHIAVLDVTNPASPSITGETSLPSPDFGDLALTDQTLFAANGFCGIRAFAITDPALPELGFWRGSHVADLAFVSPDTLFAADGSQLVKLRFDPAMPAVPPPVPQSPTPPEDARGILLSGSLDWGPAADPCDPLQYSVYFGQEIDPPLLASNLTQPHLEMPNLSPLSLYNWRVEAVDRQGDTVRGPMWRFTTVTADFPSVIPPSPPAFLKLIEDNPEVTGVVALAIAFLVGGSLWRMASSRRVVKPAPPPSRRRRDIPDWYSTKDDDSTE